jgi:hypothetical protein
MRQVLAILTEHGQSPPGLDMAALVERQRRIPDQEVEVLDFSKGEPDYAAAVEKIFQADSVQVW